jgi:hypothetical protein
MNKPQFNSSCLEIFACTKNNCITKKAKKSKSNEQTAIQTVSTKINIAANSTGMISL